MSKDRAARIADSKDSSKHRGAQSTSGGESRQGGTSPRRGAPAAKAARKPT